MERKSGITLRSSSSTTPSTTSRFAMNHWRTPATPLRMSEPKTSSMVMLNKAVVARMVASASMQKRTGKSRQRSCNNKSGPIVMPRLLRCATPPKQAAPVGFYSERALAALHSLRVAPLRDASYALPAPILSKTHLASIYEMSSKYPAAIIFLLSFLFCANDLCKNQLYREECD